MSDESLDLYVLAEIRGELAEEKVKEVLEELEEGGLIKKFGQTMKFSQEDREGIDFIILPNKGKEIRLQVKSSFCLEEMKKYHKRGVFYLGNVTNMTREQIKERLLDIVEKATNN